VTLLFAVLGLVMLGSAWYWLVAVLALFVATRIAMALALPLTAGGGAEALREAQMSPNRSTRTSPFVKTVY
jgi:hypothetical protein